MHAMKRRDGITAGRQQDPAAYGKSVAAATLHHQNVKNVRNYVLANKERSLY